MKPVFAIDMTNDKKNTKPNSDEFIVKRADEELRQKNLEQGERMMNLMEDSKLPLALRIVMNICGYAALLIAVGMLSSIIAVGFAQCRQNAPELFWICGVCFAVWLPLWIAARARAASVQYDVMRLYSEFESNEKEMEAKLCVPEDAKKVEILEFDYKLKNGKIVPLTPGLMPTPYINPQVNAHRDDKYLYISSSSVQYAFELDSLRTLRKVNKRIGLIYWDEVSELTAEKRKRFGLYDSTNGCFYMKWYYILELERSGETWGIYFPSYDIDAVCELTGLAPVES